MFKDVDLVAAFGYKFRKEQIVIVSGKRRQIPCDGDSFPFVVTEKEIRPTYCCESTGARERRGDSNEGELHFEESVWYRLASQIKVCAAMG
jgi:hypothetical protein